MTWLRLGSSNFSSDFSLRMSGTGNNRRLRLGSDSRHLSNTDYSEAQCHQIVPYGRGDNDTVFGGPEFKATLRDSFDFRLELLQVELSGKRSSYSLECCLLLLLGEYSESVPSPAVMHVSNFFALKTAKKFRVGTKVG